MILVEEDLPRDCSLAQLSGREREVVAHLARHKTSKQIAIDLGVHENTVNKHLASVKAKWGTADRYETARCFQWLVRGEGNHPPQISSGDDYLISDPEALADLPQGAEFRLADVLARAPFGFPDTQAPAGLEALDRKFGKVMVVGLVMSQVLSDLL